MAHKQQPIVPDHISKVDYFSHHDFYGTVDEKDRTLADALAWHCYQRGDALQVGKAMLPIGILKI